MTTIAIIGADGFVGTALCTAFNRKADHRVTPVVRANYQGMKQFDYDILINAAMPSKRFWAENNPQDDLRETVQKTADLVNGWRYKKFIQISTVSARCQLDTVYGRHKAAAEALCAGNDHLIVRLGSMYGNGLNKGVLIDMLNNQKVFVDQESRYCFTPVEFAAAWIAAHLGSSGTIEVGARDAVSLKEIAAYIGSTSVFEGKLDHQEIQDPSPDFPQARLVFNFLDQIRKEQGCRHQK